MRIYRISFNVLILNILLILSTFFKELNSYKIENRRNSFLILIFTWWLPEQLQGKGIK